MTSDLLASVLEVPTSAETSTGLLSFQSFGGFLWFVDRWFVFPGGVIRILDFDNYDVVDVLIDDLALDIWRLTIEDLQVKMHEWWLVFEENKLTLT